MFRPEHVHQFREHVPGINILVHPECPQEVNDLADVSGSTGKIITTIENAPKGSKWAIGTEMHLVERLKNDFPTWRSIFCRRSSVCAPRCIESTWLISAGA